MHPLTPQCRLLVYANEWAMRELPKDAERWWSREEIFDEVVRAGFEGMQAPVDWAEAVRAAGLRFCAAGRANTPAEVHAMAARARDCGAEFVTFHLGWGDESDAQMDALAASTLAATVKYGVPLWPETHRATCLQDVWRTLRLLERFPELRLNLDLSHYYCSHETAYRGFESNAALWRPILDRGACFHGRVASSQVMQIPICDGAYRADLANFKHLWKQAMTFWWQQARADDELVFIPELGPPSSGYALTVPAPGGKRTELADRWAEMQQLAEMARDLFAWCAAERDAASSHAE
jgi:hypothetical protein